MSQATAASSETTNRVGLRTGQVSEMTLIVPLKAGAADRLRAIAAENKNDPRPNLLGALETLHDMRWVLFNDDKQAVFATTYDGDWDSYIDDFAAKIPQVMDQWFGVIEGYPGITSPTIKDFFAAHQVSATTWFCAYPDLRVKDIERHRKIAGSVNELLDAVNP